MTQLLAVVMPLVRVPYNALEMLEKVTAHFGEQRVDSRQAALGDGRGRFFSVNNLTKARAGFKWILPRQEAASDKETTKAFLRKVRRGFLNDSTLGRWGTSILGSD